MVGARSPIRTPARKSVVGSPRAKPTSPPRQRSLPAIEPVAKQATYGEQTTSTGATFADHMASSIEKGPTHADQMAGATYADQMARINSHINSEHAPPKPEGMPSPKRSPVKVAMHSGAGLDGSRYQPSARFAKIVGPHRILHLVPWDQKEAGKLFEEII